MNEQSAYLVQAVRGPLIMITIGVLFAFDRFTEFRFSQTWPVLLIVVGLLRLVGGPRRRYRDYYQPPAGAPQVAPIHDHPPQNMPPARPSPRYAESPYSQQQPPAQGPEGRQ
jgi:hypothetical protein